MASQDTRLMAAHNNSSPTTVTFRRATAADASEVAALYIASRRGVGDAMLAHAKHLRPAGLRLWTFQRNAPARRFYEARGFVAIQFTDGATCMERDPDVLYQWHRSTE